MDYARLELADRLAADYVAGTLRGPARRRFEGLLPSHPRLRSSVSDWQLRLMPLTQSVAPVEPPPWLWKRIEERLGGVSPVRAAAAEAKPSWWQQLFLWRSVAGVATVAAVSFAVLFASPQPVQPPVVVVLAATTGPTQGQGAFVAGISGDGRAVVTRPIVPVSVQADRSLELWALRGEAAPKSLGVISDAQASVVQRDRLPDGATGLAVTLEPPGGSPSGAPTGPVLYAGKFGT